jgi:hypothetical protein
MKVVPVSSHDIDAFHDLKPNSFFSSKGWCNCYDEKLKRFYLVDEKENTVGGFVAYEGGKAGLKTLITPPFAPHIGLFANEQKNNPVKIITYRKQIVEAIANFLKSSSYAYYKLDFAPEWNDMQPMIWSGIATQVRYTYRLDLSRSIEELSQNLDSNKRNKINKASREGFIADHKPEKEIAWRMISETLGNNSIALHPQILKNILEFASNNETGIWSIVRKDDAPLSVNICLRTSDICYNLLSSIDRSFGYSHAGTFGLFSSILEAKSSGHRIFDFEGSGVPEIEEFFRSFGGELTAYYSVSGGKWPWPMLLRWKQKKARI